MPVQALSADTRSLDEIYEAAQKESGPLFVASGGDGEYPIQLLERQPTFLAAESH